MSSKQSFTVLDLPYFSAQVSETTPGREDMAYSSARTDVPPAAELYIFSDGVYEVDCPNGTMQTWDEFCQYLQRERPSVDAVIYRARSMHGADEFEDDFSLLKVSLK